MEEDFENVVVFDATQIWSSVEYESKLNGKLFVSLSDWDALMAAHKDLKERHQKLLDLAGSSYL